MISVCFFVKIEKHVCQTLFHHKRGAMIFFVIWFNVIFVLFFIIAEACVANPFPNGHVTTTKDAIYKAGTILPIDCDAAYTSKSIATTCTASRQWDPQPACKLVCNDTTKVRSDAVQAYPKIGIGHTGNVTYRTNHFHLRSGTLTVECKENGELSWEETPLFGNAVCIIALPSMTVVELFFVTIEHEHIMWQKYTALPLYYSRVDMFIYFSQNSNSANYN